MGSNNSETPLNITFKGNILTGEKYRDCGEDKPSPNSGNSLPASKEGIHFDVDPNNIPAGPSGGPMSHLGTPRQSNENSGLLMLVNETMDDVMKRYRVQVFQHQQRLAEAAKHMAYDPVTKTYY